MTTTITPGRLPAACEDCGQVREMRTCEDCGTTADVLDCGHYAQPAAIAASAYSPYHDVCAECEGRRRDDREV